MWNGDIAPVVSPTLERIAAQQIAEYPDDDAVLERLFAFIRQTRPTLAEISQCVCQLYCLEPDELWLRRSRLEVVLPRQIFCFLAHRHTRHSLVRIGSYINRDHSTVWWAVRKVERLVSSRPVVADDLDVLRLMISEKVLRRPVKIGRA
jgi:chromosomal replication initiation ATPase DnaA